MLVGDAVLLGVAVAVTVRVADDVGEMVAEGGRGVDVLVGKTGVGTTRNRS